MQQQVQERLASLKKEFEVGQKRLQQLEQEQTYLRETMLRISGAIQVLQELVGEPDAGASAVAATPGARDDIGQSGGANHQF